MKYDIKLDTDIGSCEVTVPTSGKVFRTTPQALGLSLLGEAAAATATAAPATPTTRARNITWMADYLGTHGVAVGRRNKSDITLAVLPPKSRTVNWYGPRGGNVGTYKLTAVFPHVLAMLHMRDGKFLRGLLWVPKVEALPKLAVTSSDPTLASFPFGNVYSGRGAICWGSVQHSGITSIADLETLFFTSGFNTDLYYPQVLGSSCATLDTLVQQANRKTGDDKDKLPVPPAASYTVSVVSAIQALVGADD